MLNPKPWRWAFLMLLLPALALPEEEAPAPKDLGGVRRWMETEAKTLSWPMTYQEDDLLVAGTTGDAKATKACFDLCKEALAKFCAVLKVSPEDLRGNEKFAFIHLMKKPEYMAFAAERAKAEDNPNLVTLLDKVPASGVIVCLDPSYSLTPDAVKHLTIHLMGHRLMDHLARMHHTENIPGWLYEGVPAWLDGTLTGGPNACCVARVGYDESQYNMRQVGGRGWEDTVYHVLKTHSELKGKEKEKSPFTGLPKIGSLKFDKLGGNDVAVSWHVIRDLIQNKHKPEGFKAFLEGVLEAQKQSDAFHAAFGKSLEDYEKSWIKAVLAAPSTDKGKPKR